MHFNSEHSEQFPMEIRPLVEQEIQASHIVGRLEEAVEKATEAINALELGDENLKNFNEADLGLKGESWKAVQGFLQGAGKSKEDIWKVLEDLVVFESNNEDNVEPVVTAIMPLTTLGKIGLSLQAVAAFGCTLDTGHFLKIDKRIQDDVARWITHIFRLQNNYAHFHDEPLESLFRLTRMVLHVRYPKFLEDGYLALTQQPVFYGTMQNSLGLLQMMCRVLGLPLSCLSAVPVNSSGSMDIAALRRLVAQDVSSGRLPVFVIADVGSAISDNIDDIQQLQEVCKKNNIWLHVRGHCLAVLSLISSPTVPFTLADSVSLNLSSWLGLPGLPMCLLYRKLESTQSRVTGSSREDAIPLIAGLVSDGMTRKLTALPLWFILQAMGREGLRDRIKTCLTSSHKIWNYISKLQEVRILSRFPLCASENLPISELAANPATSPYSLFEVTANVIIFQYVPENENGVAFTGRVPSYYDKLNSWMGQILVRDVPQVNVETCDLENIGLALRLSLLEGVNTVTSEDVDLFLNCLAQQLEILTATVKLKSVFQKKVMANPRLRLVEMPGWAGLGGVCYLPVVETEEGEKLSNNLEEINKLNMELVEKLRNTDIAFSLGEGVGGLVCVRFGMVTVDTDVEELLGLVLAVGAQVEESARNLDFMVEIVKKGIETATMDLQKETEERIWHDGILRQVPVFSSIVNWWSPKSETGVKGRSLNLQAGVVESTENIYRYHMQLQQGAATHTGSKQPPQPQVQTPIVAEGKAHSRSSSHASHTSNTSNTTNFVTTSADS